MTTRRKFSASTIRRSGQFYSETEIAQARMVIGPAAQRPMILALAFLDGQVVDAGDAQPNQALAIELPILVAVAAMPLSTVVMPFIGEAHGDAAFAEGPNFLDQAVVELSRIHLRVR